MDTIALESSNKKASNRYLVFMVLSTIFLLLGLACTLIVIRNTNLYFIDYITNIFSSRLRAYRRITLEGLNFLTIYAVFIFIVGTSFSTLALFDNKKGKMAKITFVINVLFLISGIVFLLFDKHMLYDLIY